MTRLTVDDAPNVKDGDEIAPEADVRGARAERSQVDIEPTRLLVWETTRATPVLHPRIQ